MPAPQAPARSPDCFPPSGTPRSASFHFNALPFSIPYPVPFRRLGDERKGWLDVTYLAPDGRFRLSRGNKVRGPMR